MVERNSDTRNLGLLPSTAEGSRHRLTGQNACDPRGFAVTCPPWGSVHGTEADLRQKRKGIQGKVFGISKPMEQLCEVHDKAAVPSPAHLLKQLNQSLQISNTQSPGARSLC